MSENENKEEILENEQIESQENNENIENVEDDQPEEIDTNNDNNENEEKGIIDTDKNEDIENNEEENEKDQNNNEVNEEDEEKDDVDNQKDDVVDENEIPIIENNIETQRLSHANVYEWVDSFKFSNQKKNITRDFTDGLNMVEILYKITNPPIIYKHATSKVLKKEQKIANWKEIQRCLHLKSIIKLSDIEIEGIVEMKPYVLEKFLERIFKLNGAGLSILKCQQKHSQKTPVNNYIKAIKSRYFFKLRVICDFEENVMFKNENKKNLDDNLKTKEELFELILEDKNNKIKEIKEIVDFMKNKINNLRDENSIYEEMINRYKLKLGKYGEYYANDFDEQLSSV